MAIRALLAPKVKLEVWQTLGSYNNGKMLPQDFCRWLSKEATMKTRTRSAFTLFQLLIILCPFGDPVALLIPSIAKVRLAAAPPQIGQQSEADRPGDARLQRRQSN